MEVQKLTDDRITLVCTIASAQIRQAKDRYPITILKDQEIEVPETEGLVIKNNVKVPRYGFAIVKKVQAKPAPALNAANPEDLGLADDEPKKKKGILGKK